MQFVSAGETYPAVHFASGWSIVSVKLLTQPMKMVLSQSFRFVQQRADYLASGGSIVVLFDVIGDDPEV